MGGADSLERRKQKPSHAGSPCLAGRPPPSPARQHRPETRANAQRPLTPNALLAVIPFDENRNLPSLIVDYQDRKQLAIDLILKARPIP